MIIFLIVLLVLAVIAAALAFKAYINVKNDYYILDNSYEVIRDYAEDCEKKVAEWKSAMADILDTLEDFYKNPPFQDDNDANLDVSSYKEGIEFSIETMTGRIGITRKNEEKPNA